MTKASWQRTFDDPIAADGRTLRTLRDAADYITELPKTEHERAPWQAAIEALIMAAENRGRADARADWRAAGAEPERRAGIQPRPERPALGTAEAGKGSIVKVGAMSAFARRTNSSQTSRHVRKVQPAQPVDATQALNLSAGVSNCKVSRGRSLS